MDVDTELRVIAELRALAHAYGWRPGTERADELLDERLQDPDTGPHCAGSDAQPPPSS